METIISSIPGYRLYDYQLVLEPHEELWARVMHVKEKFAETYKTDLSRWSKPYLALVTFQQYEMMEERIFNRLKTLAMGYPPFKVEIKDFGSFPSHTVYLNISSRLPVQNLVKLVRSETQRLMKVDEDRKPLFMMEPHITIGRKLKPWQYEKAWLEYSHLHFTGRFIANRLTVLKRLAGELKYQVAARFDFENLPVATKQGELF